MLNNIDRRILNIDRTICDNIDLIDFPNISRALVSQNLLGQSRNLCEHIAVKIYGNNSDIDANWETIPAALEFIKHEYKIRRNKRKYMEVQKCQ
jgi:ABC-type sulfate transport system permease subunit